MGSESVCTLPVDGYGGGDIVATLKPCPFCASYNMCIQLDIGRGGYTTEIFCYGCRAGFTFDPYDSIDEGTKGQALALAIAAWNRRTPEPKAAWYKRRWFTWR